MVPFGCYHLMVFIARTTFVFRTVKIQSEIIQMKKQLGIKDKVDIKTETTTNKFWSVLGRRKRSGAFALLFFVVLACHLPVLDGF